MLCRKHCYRILAGLPVFPVILWLSAVLAGATLREWTAGAGSAGVVSDSIYYYSPGAPGCSSEISSKISQRPGSNWLPAHYECAALPTELRWRKLLICVSLYRHGPYLSNIFIAFRHWHFASPAFRQPAGLFIQKIQLFNNIMLSYY